MTVSFNDPSPSWLQPNSHFPNQVPTPSLGRIRENDLALATWNLVGKVHLRGPFGSYPSSGLSSKL